MENASVNVVVLHLTEKLLFRIMQYEEHNDDRHESLTPNLSALIFPGQNTVRSVRYFCVRVFPTNDRISKFPDIVWYDDICLKAHRMCLWNCVVRTSNEPSMLLLICSVECRRQTFILMFRRRWNQSRRKNPHKSNARGVCQWNVTRIFVR